ncbi:unnamed protein product [Macrosiphum euphorbiae]|uniref:Uncharacterized protein n=1 Tax=Macrosiphum euphorbiae TaxID=13131 RepID=A0AAV0X4G7_9HEMI|nr:unnamed protein product [Macrosiphum euphorbiae]
MKSTSRSQDYQPTTEDYQTAERPLSTPAHTDKHGLEITRTACGQGDDEISESGQNAWIGPNNPRSMKDAGDQNGRCQDYPNRSAPPCAPA